MTNQENISEGSVLSELFYVIFLGFPQTAACDSERCPDVHFGDKVKDKMKILSSIFPFARMRSFAFGSEYSFVSGLVPTRS